MGIVFSSELAREDHVNEESERKINNMASCSDDNIDNLEFHDAIDETDDREERIKAKEAEMEAFRRQLQIKREQRRGILDRHKAEKKELEICLDNERRAKLEAYESNKSLRELLILNNIDIPEQFEPSKENADIKDTIVNMKEEFEKLKSSNNKLRRDLADSNVSLQGAYSDIADLNLQNRESMKQINALKEVVAVSKTMLSLRENQLDELKAKLSEIERSLADREANMLSSDLRQEYERQLQNIRSLRTLYEDRARLAEVTRQGLLRELEEQKVLKQAEIEKVEDLRTKVQELETRVDELQETISNKNNQIYTCQDETRGLKMEMSAINKLFSQVLLGYKNKQDLDKLVHRLEENHGILTHMAENENDSEASSALPKLLLEIVSQVDEGQEAVKSADADETEEFNGTGKNETIDAESSVNMAAEEIVQNLPKVWRVLIELLSQQTATEDNENEKVTTCYKTVETKTGPVQVPSVSQTYIRLKDLIVEKLGLIKEVNRMKQLNVHLETRLEEQERRLCLVTNELSKTWHVVGRLRRHHHQLHTHEKILKYELQQKRKLLTELKEELEYCREKWDQAREKNTQSEKDWRKLRAEFSSRNTKSSISFNNSAESGYSDERPSDESSESNDESEYVTEPLIRSRKKVKKSFETILDSSTDRNLAAEREDPASDMLDVADLPLDTQAGDDHQDESHLCNSESNLKSDKICETEDEVGDIAHDSCTEDHSAADCSQASDHVTESINTTHTSLNSFKLNEDTPAIDPTAILKSIKDQNERLAKKDKKLEKLEKSGASLLLKTQSTLKLSDQINATLDHLLNRPSSSTHPVHRKQENIDEVPKTKNTKKENDNDYKKINDSYADLCSLQIINNVSTTSHLTNKHPNERVYNNDERENPKLQEITDDQSSSSSINIFAANFENDIAQTQHLSQSIDNTTEAWNINKNMNENKIVSDNIDVVSSEPSSSDTQTLNVDFKEILKSVKNQSERLIQKDARLNNLENSCSEVVKNLNCTLDLGEKLVEKLNCLQEKKSEDNLKEASDSSTRDSSEPSTSSEVDHEALFAARDLRLKRLEEQTKSLVNKVNKTTDKGVKIHYKLEELHNIYGSESSRASTPSDNEEKGQRDDDKEKHDEYNSQSNGENDHD